MLKNSLRLLLVITLFASPFSVFCADDDSRFLMTTSDQVIFGTSPIPVLSYTLNLTQTKTVLLAANGRYYPFITTGLAVVNIRVDGQEYHSNYSIIDWRSSQDPVQHSFDCIAVVTLQPGTHTIELIAFNHVYTPSAGFVLGSMSGLSVMTNPAPNVLNSTLDDDSPVIDYNTNGLGCMGCQHEIPYRTLLTNNVNTGNNPTNVVSLLSGRVYCAGTQGDALWGIYLNGQCPSANNSNWAVNDIFDSAELAAPMYCFAMHTITGSNALSFNASELPLYEGNEPNLVQYRV